MKQQSVRYHGLDALRAIAMLLGIVLHASIVYQLDPRFGWPHDPGHQHIFYDWLYHWIHTFRMPLFFILAGFFARFLYYRIGQKKFIKHRYNRIFIPLAVSVFIILPICNVTFLWAGNNELKIPDLTFFYNKLSEILQWRGLYHLWFLYYLLFFYISMLIFLQITKYLKIRLPANFIIKPYSLKFIAFLSVIYFLIVLFFFQDKIEAWTGLTLKYGQLSYYGLFFFSGYLINRDPGQLINIRSNKILWAYFLLSLVISILLVQFGKELNLIVYKLLLTFETIFMTVGSLGLFMYYFRNENKGLRYITDSSYWFYLIHLPIIVFFQVALIHLGIPAMIGFILNLSITTIISLLTYQLFVRHTIIGVYLHGKK